VLSSLEPSLNVVRVDRDSWSSLADGLGMSGAVRITPAFVMILRVAWELGRRSSTEMET
jgi:hypothetical protein